MKNSLNDVLESLGVRARYDAEDLPLPPDPDSLIETVEELEHALGIPKEIPVEISGSISGENVVVAAGPEGVD